jgi:phosphohistidine phosphatase SixA
VTVLLVRHGSAGERANWNGDDRLRPLDARGRAQADGLVAQLRGWTPSRILTSRYLRCRETVAPLADVLGLAIEDATELEEGSTADDVRTLVAQIEEAVIVLCTHGDVVEDVLGGQSEKGSTWVLGLDGGEFSRIAYVPPV